MMPRRVSDETRISDSKTQLGVKRKQLVEAIIRTILSNHRKAGYPQPSDTQIEDMRMQLLQMILEGNLHDEDIYSFQRKLRHACGAQTAERDNSLAISGGRFTPDIKQSRSRLEAQEDNVSSVSMVSRVSLPRTSIKASPVSMDTSASKRTNHPLSDDMWAQLSLQEADMFQREQKAEVIRKRQRAIAAKAALDAQVVQREEIKRRTDEEERRYAELEDEQRQKWEHEQDELERKKRKENEAEKLIRDAQLRQQTMRRKEEKKQLAEQEMMFAARIQEDIRLEKESEMERKQRERENVQRFLEYNSKQKALKASQAQAEIESDRRHQLEYLAKLEQQEKDRERALKKTYERSARAAKVCSMPVPSPEQMQAPPGRGAAQLSDKLADAEAKRIRRLREDKEKVQDVLVQQMKRKKDMMHEERAAEMKFSTELNAQALKAEEEAKKLVRQKKETEKKHWDELHEQIETKRRERPLYMSPTEQKINKVLLRSYNIA